MKCATRLLQPALILMACNGGTAEPHETCPTRSCPRDASSDAEVEAGDAGPEGNDAGGELADAGDDDDSPHTYSIVFQGSENNAPAQELFWLKKLDAAPIQISGVAAAGGYGFRHVEASPDGKMLLYDFDALDTSTNGVHALVRTDTGWSTPKPLAMGQAGNPLWPIRWAFSDAGARVFYRRWTHSPEQLTLWFVDVARNGTVAAPVQIGPAATDIDTFVVQSATRVFFRAGMGFTIADYEPALYMVEIAGSTPGAPVRLSPKLPKGTAAGVESWLQLSEDRKVLAYKLADPARALPGAWDPYPRDIYVMDVSGAKPGAALRITEPAGALRFGGPPVMSADGHTVAYLHQVDASTPGVGRVARWRSQGNVTSDVAIPGWPSDVSLDTHPLHLSPSGRSVFGLMQVPPYDASSLFSSNLQRDTPSELTRVTASTNPVSFPVFSGEGIDPPIPPFFRDPVRERIYLLRDGAHGPLLSALDASGAAPVLTDLTSESVQGTAAIACDAKRQRCYAAQATGATPETATVGLWSLDSSAEPPQATLLWSRKDAAQPRWLRLIDSGRTAVLLSHNGLKCRATLIDLGASATATLLDLEPGVCDIVAAERVKLSGFPLD